MQIIQDCKFKFRLELKYLILYTNIRLYIPFIYKGDFVFDISS